MTTTVHIRRDRWDCEAVVCSSTGTIHMAGLSNYEGRFWAESRGFRVLAEDEPDGEGDDRHHDTAN